MHALIFLQDPNFEKIITPKIDEAIEAFKHRCMQSLDTSNTVSSTDLESNLTPTRQVRSHRPGSVQVIVVSQHCVIFVCRCK